jgi:hypothetical protein
MRRMIRLDSYFDYLGGNGTRETRVVGFPP